MSWVGETGHEYIIEICEKNYTGEVLTLRQGAAPVLRMDDGDAIRGTSLELTLEAEKDGQLAGFYTTDGKRYHVDLKRNGRTIWQGFTLPELYAEPCVAPPYDVKVTASDGLGLLKNADYEATYGMEVSLLGGIRHITSQTGLSLGFAIANTLMASVMDQSRCMLVQALIRQDALLGMTYYEALEKILNSIGAYITQKDGRWHIVRYTDATTDRTLVASDGYTQEGVMSARILTVGNLSDDTYPLGPELSMEIEPAMRSVEMHQPYELRDSFLSNWDFSGGSTDWQHSANGVKFGWWVGDYYARLQHTRPGSEMSYIEQGVGVTAVDEPLVVAFDYGMVYGINMPGVPAGIALEFDFIVMLTEGGRTHYLSRDGWQDGACVIKVSTTLQAGRLYRDGRSRWYYPETYDTFTVNLEQVPWSGTLTIRILNPYQARPQTGSVIVDKDLRNDLYVKNIKVMHNLPDKEKVDIVLNDAASKADGALNIGFTDVPFTANASLTFANGIRTERGWTSEWSCAGVASGNFGEMALQSRAGIVGYPKMLMRGTIRAVDFDLVTDKYSGKQLYLRECEYNLLEEEMTVTLCEYRDAGWSISGSYGGARLAERGGRKVVRKVSETEHRSYTADRSLTTAPKMIRQLRRETAISEDLLLEVDDGASPDTRKATLADLLQPAWKKSELVHDGGYLLVDGRKIKAGDSDAWEGRRTADWMDQPVRQGDGVTFREVAVSEVMKTLGAIDSIAAGKGTIITADGRIQTDRLEVRNSLKVLELLINKVRSVGGQICVSAANGKVRSVTEDGDDYRISFEQENIFRAHDLMRCRTFTGEKQDYWVEVKDANANGVVVAKSEFAGAIPREGDECVLMGNTTDIDRQNMVLISATEDGQPRVDVLNRVNRKSLDGALRARLGNLDGIKDEWFPANRQPRGDGLYADNAFLKGTFVLETGEDVKTRFEVTEGKVQSAIDSIRGDLAEESYLNNPTFSRGLEKWDSENETVFFLVGNMWVWANDGILSQSGDGASVVTDNGRTVVRIRNKYILQRNSNLRYIPNFPVNEDGKKEALPVYLSFFYRCRKAGTLRIRFENVDKTGFANFNSLDVTEAIGETDGYVQYSYSGKWNGTGDFRIDFDGDIYLCMLVLSTDKIDALAYKYRTLFEQSDRLVKISAAVFDKDEQLLEETGIVTTSKMAGLYAIDGDGNLKSFVGAGQDGVKIKASNIQLEGLVTANENFKILGDGSIEAQNAKVKGYIYSIFKEINLSDAINLGYNSNTRNNEYKLKQNLYVDATFCGVVLPVSEEYEGARVIVMDSYIVKTKTSMPPTTIRAETGNVLSGLFYQDPGSRYPNCSADVVTIDCGTVELILKNMANRNHLTGEIMSYSLQWVLVSSSCQHLRWEINGASFDYKYNLSY